MSGRRESAAHDAPLAAGYHALRGAMAASRCRELLGAVAAARGEREAPLVERREKGRALRYRVVDGLAVRERLPSVWALRRELMPLAERLWGGPLVPWADARVAVNVNITPPGGEYRWHYDRNPVTLLLYLNAVPGGEIELYPNYRLVLRGSPWLQEAVDRALRLSPIRRLLGRRVVIAPEPGLLLAMAGRRCLHSVRTVGGTEERVNVVVSYGIPGERVRAPALDAYLYAPDATPVSRRDPNYAPAARER